MAQELYSVYPTILCSCCRLVVEKSSRGLLQLHETRNCKGFNYQRLGTFPRTKKRSDSPQTGFPESSLLRTHAVTCVKCDHEKLADVIIMRASVLS